MDYHDTTQMCLDYMTLLFQLDSYQGKFIDSIVKKAFGRVNLINSVSVLNTGNKPQSSLSVCNGDKGRKAPINCVERHISGI